MLSRALWTRDPSSGQRQVYDFIIGLGVECSLEYKVGGLQYDICVPSQNLLIEFHGLKWHSFEHSKLRDQSKYTQAVAAGYQYFAIYEDEWLNRKLQIQSIIRNRLGLGEGRSLRPSQCTIRQISSQECETLYDQNHYLGSTPAIHNYGAFFEDRLIACVSFNVNYTMGVQSLTCNKLPDCPSKYEYEWVRMAGDTGFRVHGIWSKLMGRFIQDYNPGSIVSFSDNRLFSGQVYEKIGFRYDGLVSPDYYWCKGLKRYNKSDLAEPSGHWESNGWRRIWDLGKTRWLWQP